MSYDTEMVLANIDGSTMDERLVLVLCQVTGGESHLELRQESWADGIGWFTQNRVRVDREQVSDLRSAFGVAGGNAAPRSFSRNSGQTIGGFVPRVIHADSA